MIAGVQKMKRLSARDRRPKPERGLSNGNDAQALKPLNACKHKASSAAWQATFSSLHTLARVLLISGCRKKT